MEKSHIQGPRSKFLNVKCLECGHEQIVFGCTTRAVTCEQCGKELARPRGGKAQILTKITQVLG